MADEYVFTNNAEAILAAEMAGGATSFTVATGDGAKFPDISVGSGKKFPVILSDGAVSEQMTVTSRAGDIFSVTRTGANTFDAGSTVKLVLISEILEAFLQKGVMREVTGNPDGTLAAEYDGEEVYDPTAEHFYKHLTGTAWALMA